VKSKFLFVLVLSTQVVYAQKYKSISGTIKFYSEELLENITAVNHEVKSMFDSESGQIVFSLPITGFDFEKSLMREHFNEKYLESEKFPKSTFKGKMTGFTVGQINPEVWAKGELVIHGTRQNITVLGQLDFKKYENVLLHSVFVIKLVDYNIKVPELLFQKIAEEIEVTIDIVYKPYEN